MNFLLLTSFGEVMSYIGYILLAVLVLLVMITVHELGHYIAGKIFGFGIQEFAIGFGPKIYKKEKKNGEIFSVRLFPLGGFCSFKGEDEKGEDPEDFNNKKPWQRLIVLVSGAFMNYLLALLIIIFTFFLRNYLFPSGQFIPFFGTFSNFYNNRTTFIFSHNNNLLLGSVVTLYLIIYHKS